ncbi:MAG: 23S rRNA (adenine(2503)-C(2))-methyltransferase RlmN [Candidatus Omnitrophota bacterium]
MEKRDIKDIPIEELKKDLSGMGQASYRAVQIFRYIYQEGIVNFAQAVNLPKILRERLDESYCISNLRVIEHLKSADDCEKFLFKLSDGNLIETVLISAKARQTICLSTQVGCKFHCVFCASGQAPFKRNLFPQEMLGQILFVLHRLKRKVTNYVFMGMGEPLDNIEHLLTTLKIMNCRAGLNIGARRITVSTCGLIPGMKRLKDSGLAVNLSVSIHAAQDKLRASLMPVNRQYPLTALMRACAEFSRETKRIITLEYILFKGVNDSMEDADNLAQLSRKLRAKVNLIGYNSVSGEKFFPAEQQTANRFMYQLLRQGIQVTLRESRGKGIQAACGQLAGGASFRH